MSPRPTTARLPSPKPVRKPERYLGTRLRRLTFGNLLELSFVLLMFYPVTMRRLPGPPAPPGLRPKMMRTEAGPYRARSRRPRATLLGMEARHGSRAKGPELRPVPPSRKARGGCKGACRLPRWGWPLAGRRVRAPSGPVGGLAGPCAPGRESRGAMRGPPFVLAAGMGARLSASAAKPGINRFSRPLALLSQGFSAFSRRF